MELVANFILNNENFNTLFEIYASGTTWGNISGALSNQEDLQEALDSKASNERVDGIVASFDNDIEEINTNISGLQTTVSDNYSDLNTKIQNESATRTENDNLLQGDINTLSDNLTAEISNRESVDSGLQTQITNLTGTVSSNYSILDNKIDSVESDLQGDIDTLENAVNTNTSNISTLNTTVSNLSNTVDDLSDTVVSNYNILDTKINTTQTTLQGNIDTLSGTVTSNYNDLTQSITNNVSTLNTRITNEVSTLNGAISDEATARANADNNLQTQIDAITTSSDVFDIVGTYAELEAYDISTVPVNDIIKVLIDSTHNNAATYYRCIETSGVKSWAYIGSEGAYYTKGEADSTFVPQTRTINNKPLNQNINLTASDVGALPVGTQIGNGTILLTQGGVQKGTFTLNQTGNATIDFDAGGSSITVDSALSTTSENPVQNKVITTELNKKIEGINFSDVTTALGYTPYNSTNPNGYTSNVGTVTSVNNTSPDSNGNVTLSIPSVDQTFNSISTNAQSGTAVAEAISNKQNTLVSGTNIKTINNSSLLGSGNISALENTAADSSSLTINGNQTDKKYSINIGENSSANSQGSTAVGYNSSAGAGALSYCVAIGHGSLSDGGNSIAIGAGAKTSMSDAIQIGYGTNTTQNSLQIGNYQLLNLSTGLIPDARLNATNFDGAWVGSLLTAFSNVTLSATPRTVDLSSYLPNDGYDYLVGLTILGKPNTAGIIAIILGDYYTQVRTRGAVQNVNSESSGYIVVGNDRTVQCSTITGTWTTAELRFFAYRRIGTNQ